MALKFGERLVETRRITRDDLDEALDLQASGGAERLGDALVAAGKLKSADLAKTVSEHFDLPYVELPTIESGIFRLLPVEVQQQHRIVPFALDDHQVSVAVAEPLEPQALAELEAVMQRRVKVYVASADDIDAIHGAATGAFAAQVEAEPKAFAWPALTTFAQGDFRAVLSEIERLRRAFQVLLDSGILSENDVAAALQDVDEAGRR
jgi:Type II secretion system (T2SS), protein E, N-terminal domain